MTTDVLADAGQRERALDVARSFIVQAPAGSGKTGLLTQRFLRLLAIVDRPEEILAITFTRKAAAEMRMRIVKALRRAGAGEVGEDAYHAAVLDDARRALARDTAQGWGLVAAPERLQIMTLDALNGRLVGAMPVTARAARVRIVEAELQEGLYAEAAAALLDWLAMGDAPGEAVRHFLGHLDASGFAWRNQIVAMLKRRDQWLPVLVAARRGDSRTLRAASESVLRTIVSDAVAGLDARLPDVHRAELLGLLRGAEARLVEAGARVATPLPEHWPAPDADAVGFWRRIAEALLTKDGNFRRQVDKRQGFPPKPAAAKADKDAFVALLEALADDGLAESLHASRSLPEAHYDDAQWRTVEALLELLPIAAAELERVMSERGVADYTALAGSAIEALGDPDAGRVTDLGLRLDYRISHILVDEMQDTAPSQYRLLDALTAGWESGDGRTLFCVGDPMQSIYRFRGADVSLFLDAWSTGIGALEPERLVLSTNFRSEAGIIDWVNRHFAEILGDTNDPLTDSVGYRHADPRPDAGEGGVVRWHTGIDEAAPGPEAVVAEVRRLRAEHPDETVAILARKRGALEPILAGLRHEGIACEAIDMDRLTELPEIIDLVNLTRALEHPDDRLSWLGLLRSPLLGWSLEDIDVFVRRCDDERGDETVADRLEDPAYSAHLDAQGTELLARFVAVYRASRQAAPILSLRDRVERLWCALGGPAALEDAAAAEHVWLYLDALSRLERDGQLDSLPDLVPSLDELRASRHAEAPKVYAMTIFRSKGLEFDHVLLPELQAGSQARQRPPILFDVRAGQAGGAVLFSADASRADAGNDDLHELLWQRERHRDLNELDRLLYVATTRARRSLHLFAGTIRKADGSLKTATANTLLGRFGRFGVAAFEGAPDRADAAAPGQGAAHEWLTAMRGRVEPGWQPPPLPAPGGDARFSLAPGTDPVEFDWAGSGARHVGTVVHAWLHRLAGCGDPAAALANVADLDARSRALLGQLGVAPEDLDDNVARVRAALEGATAGADAGWLIGGAGPEDRAEFALGALAEDRVVRLVIDRIVRDADGALWVVDYKTSRHEGGDLEGFFANECRRYRQQLEGYADAVSGWYAQRGTAMGPLRLGLYFTLYGRLVPLETEAPPG